MIQRLPSYDLVVFFLILGLIGIQEQTHVCKHVSKYVTYVYFSYMFCLLNPSEG